MAVARFCFCKNNKRTIDGGASRGGGHGGSRSRPFQSQSLWLAGGRRLFLPLRAASGPSADSHLDPQAGLLERAAGGPADGVRSGAADVRRRQPAKIVRRASGRREVAAVVATIARTMGLCVEEEKDLSSWAKIAFWLQEQRAITDLFGRLHVPHSLFQMEGKIPPPRLESQRLKQY